MSINRTCLHAFHIVASQGSFSKAATANHVSQPTLSAQVKELEDRYKLSLFERYGGGVRLTSVGETLYQITLQMFDLEVQAERLLLSMQSRIIGRLRIGADSPYLIIPLMKKFQGLYPDVKLSVEFGNSRHLLACLKSRKYDVIVLPTNRSSDQLYSRDLLSDRLIFFVSRDHPWAKKQSTRLCDLVNEKVVLRERGSNTRSRFENILNQRGIKLDPKSIFIISSREGVKEAVAAGLGVSVVAESEFGHDKRLHPVVIRDVKRTHTEYLVCLEKRKTEQMLETFFNTAF